MNASCVPATSAAKTINGRREVEILGGRNQRRAVIGHGRGLAVDEALEHRRIEFHDPLIVIENLEAHIDAPIRTGGDER